MAWNPRANEIFLQAVEAPVGPSRAALLDSACGDDAELRRQIEALLRAHDDAGSFLDHPPLAAATPDDPTVTRIPGDASAEGHSLEFLDPPQRAGSIGRLKSYEVQSVVGSGGMGVVLKALDESLDRVVAIKVLNPHYAANATARRRFVREAKAVAAVAHEHVVMIHEVREDHAPPYLVMQFVQGQSLQERLDLGGPLELKEILRIGTQIARGLAAAHAQGIIHRDIKPANILLENGIERVKLSDFGLARTVDDASVTQSGVIAGTPLFMSPEQAAGESVDHRSDLFSLGSVLYVMCTGHAPFRASGTMAVMKRVIEDSARPVREVNPEIPNWLEAIIAKLHAKKPADRFDSATEVADLLEQHLAHLQQPSQVPMPARLPAPHGAVASGAAGRRLLGPVLLMIAPLYLIPVVLAGTLLPIPGFRLVLVSSVIAAAAMTLIGVILFIVRLTTRPAEPKPAAERRSFRWLAVLLLGIGVPLLLAPMFYVAEGLVSHGGTWLGLGVVGLALLGLVTFAALRLAAPEQRIVRRWPLIVIPVTLLALIGSGYAWFSKPMRLYLDGKGELMVNDVQPEFEEFRVEAVWGRGTVSVGNVTVRNNVQQWKVKRGEPLVLPPGEYEVVALGRNGERVTRWREEGSGLFSGYATTHDGERFKLRLSRGERVWLSIAKWEAAPAADVPGRLAPDNELEGAWVFESAELAGRPLTHAENPFMPNELVISRDRWGTVLPNGNRREGGLRLRTDTNPKQIGFTGSVFAANQSPGMCIYRVEGNRLTMCAGGAVLPTTFATSPTDSNVLFVFRRATNSEGRWVPLFNGHDLTEWAAAIPTGPAGPSGWRVENGVLIGIGPVTNEVRTKRTDFANFRLRAEVKLSKTANARLLLRHEDFPGGMRGYEVQLGVGLGNERPRFDLYRGPDGRKFLQQSPPRSFPLESWFTLEVIAEHERMIVKANGEEVFNVVDNVSAKGQLGFVVSGQDTRMEVRKIEIKELPPTKLELAPQGLTADASINGEWESDRGDVTLTHAPIVGYKPVTISGMWTNKAGSRVPIDKAFYDPASGRLLVAYVDVVGEDQGTAELRVVFGGQAIVGVWTNQKGSIGGWSMWRKGRPRPKPGSWFVNGDWNSERGVVSLFQPPAENWPTIVVGSYVASPGKRYFIKNGAFNYLSGVLKFNTDEDGISGFAQFMLNADGKELVGVWANASGQRGAWTLTQRPLQAPPKSAAPAREELERLVKLQEQEVARVEERYKAGVIAANDVVAAKIQLMELRLRLATAEAKPVVPLLRELVAQHEKARDLVKALYAAAKVSASEVDAAEKAVIEARIRLLQAEAEPAK